MKHRGFAARFFLRWLVCSLGLWIAAGLLHGSVTYGHHIGAIIISGFILAILNAIIKPILVLATLPAVLLTLGLFMVVINGVTVYLASKLDPSLQISNFGVAIVTGIIIGVVNYLVTAILEDHRE
jgi:putative membrane protein